VRAARKEMARLERQLSRLTETERRLHEDLAAKSTDHEAVLLLDTRLRQVHADKQALEEEWLAAAEIAG
jgi:ATP-binding cassette subfamily F protein uup